MKKQQVNKELGSRIKLLRVEQGMRQEVLANRVRLTRTSVVNIEAGRQSLSVWTLLQFSEALGVDACDLLVPVKEFPARLILSSKTMDGRKRLTARMGKST